jgi:hypothetical protein
LVYGRRNLEEMKTRGYQETSNFGFEDTVNNSGLKTSLSEKILRERMKYFVLQDF